MSGPKPRTEELLAAYASGAELTETERAAVEALLDQSPAARREVDDIAGVLGALRDSQPEPPPPSEAVVRAVRIACAAEVPWPARARAWLRRRWSIAVPATLAASTAAVIVAMHLGRPAEPVATRPVADDHGDRAPVPVPAAPAADEVPVWLDGEATELAQLDDATAEALDRELGDELDALEGGVADPIEIGFDGILPDDDLDWVDELDDATAEELDRWLAEHPS